MKLSKEELKAKYNEMIQDNDILISLLEDIEDSMEAPAEVDTSELDSKIDELQSKLDDLTEKYKARFLSSEEKTEEPENEDEGLKEEEVIDIKEI